MVSIVKKKAVKLEAVTLGKVRRDGLKIKAKGMIKVGIDILSDSRAVPKKVPPEIFEAAKQLIATGGDMVEKMAK